MLKFANTASKVLVRGDGSIANYMDGRGTTDMPGWISHWLYFEPWAPSLFDISYQQLKTKSSVTPKELYGVALLNYVYTRNIAESGSEPYLEPAGNFIAR